MQNFTKFLKEKLAKRIPSSVFLSKLRVSDENIKKTLNYTDPTYYPTYYWIGKYINPKNICLLGFNLGLEASVLQQGCKPENFLAFQQKNLNFYSPRLGIANVKSVYKNNFCVYYGNINSFSQKIKERKWDLGIITENLVNLRDSLSLLWDNLNKESFIIIDHINSQKQNFIDFCKIKNREVTIFKYSRYNLGIIRR